MRENNFYRNFGSLSNDSVVTDIYNKRINGKKKKHKTKETTKTKQLAIENWKKFLNTEYYNKHFKDLSKSQQRKVKQYLKENKELQKYKSILERKLDEKIQHNNE